MIGDLAVKRIALLRQIIDGTFIVANDGLGRAHFAVCFLDLIIDGCDLQKLLQFIQTDWNIAATEIAVCKVFIGGSISCRKIIGVSISLNILLSFRTGRRAAASNSCSHSRITFIALVHDFLALIAHIIEIIEGTVILCKLCYKIFFQIFDAAFIIIL